MNNQHREVAEKIQMSHMTITINGEPKPTIGKGMVLLRGREWLHVRWFDDKEQMFTVYRRKRLRFRLGWTCEKWYADATEGDIRALIDSGFRVIREAESPGDPSP